MANHEKEISVSERQIYILSLLSQNPIGYTADEIVEKLKKWDVVLTKRTINRDIDELSMSYAIEEEERNGKTYFLARKFSMENVDLTIQDLMAISFMQQLVQQYEHTIMGKAAEEMLQKIASNTGNLNRKHLEELSKTIRFIDRNEWKNQDVKPEIEQMITAAIEKQNKIEIQYHSWNSDETTKRVIHPYSMTFIDQYLCVEGYCELRKELRTFRLSRIQNVTVLKEQFQIPETYHKKEEDKFIYLGGKDKEQLIIQFDVETGRYIREYEAHRADRLTENEEGVLFEKRTAITTEVIRWILRFGAGAKVVQPENLKEQIKIEIEKMKKLYQ
ncbi:MAG: WYL domain-containing protein [Lachnospiraceae bacterium]|nr:WYL domain-containing protein [Lachnospiraceae bacterium]